MLHECLGTNQEENIIKLEETRDDEFTAIDCFLLSISILHKKKPKILHIVKDLGRFFKFANL